MRRYNENLLLSASDLNTYLGCRHATALHYRASILGDNLAKSGEDETLALLQHRGDLREADHFRALRASTPGEVVVIERGDVRSGFEQTEAAMRRGADLIFQAVLWDRGSWHGYADFLVKVAEPSDLGDWSYEVHDTKLARSVKAKFAIQLGIYADLLARMQGRLPPAMRVVLGDGSVAFLGAGQLVSYVRHAMGRLERAVADGRADDPGPTTVAEPCRACPECDWRERCEEEWMRDDHLRIVANIRASQIVRLTSAGITTAKGLAALEPARQVPGISDHVLDRLRSQAALQVSVRDRPGERRFELLSPGAGKGLARLPAPDPADLFFDMEGDPLFPDGGLEYLFGMEGPGGFQAFWAYDRAGEKVAFERFMDAAARAMRKSPGARIYHYNHYEPTVLKRLAMYHGTREAELDELLREERFLDLYVVVREAVRTSEAGYSLKDIEGFYRSARQGAVGTALGSIVAFERWIENRDGEFNWSSQHSGGMLDGGSTSIGSCVARQAVFAGTTSRRAAGASAAFLGVDCGGAIQRGRGDRRGCVSTGRSTVVPKGRRHATIDNRTIIAAVVRAISVVCGAGGACDPACAGSRGGADRPAHGAVRFDDLSRTAPQRCHARWRVGLSGHHGAVAC